MPELLVEPVVLQRAIRRRTTVFVHKRDAVVSRCRSAKETKLQRELGNNGEQKRRQRYRRPHASQLIRIAAE